MNPFSILMFCFSGALLLYAILLAITKDFELIPRGYAAKVKDKKEYAKRFAEVIALTSVPPAHCGLVAMSSTGWALVVLVVEMVLAIWLGTKIMS